MLPMFPLNLVVFPGENLNLHIFETRYRQLIRECADERKTFGIPPYINNKLRTIGTEIKLDSIVKEYSDGKMDIKTHGIRKFKMLDFFNNADQKLYPAGRVEFLEHDLAKVSIIEKEKLLKLATELFTLMKINKELPEAALIESYSLAHYAGMSTSQKYDLLILPNEEERIAYLTKHLQQIIPVIRETEALKKRIQMNGHFKNEIPPQF